LSPSKSSITTLALNSALKFLLFLLILFLFLLFLILLYFGINLYLILVLFSRDIIASTVPRRGVGCEADFLSDIYLQVKGF
jgi:hypothetical protein